MLDRYLSLKKPILKSLAAERRRVRTQTSSSISSTSSSTPLLSSTNPNPTTTYQTLREKPSTEHIEMPSSPTITTARPSLLQRTTSRGEKKTAGSYSYSPTSSPEKPTFESLSTGRHANQWLFQGWGKFVGGSGGRS